MQARLNRGEGTDNKNIAWQASGFDGTRVLDGRHATFVLDLRESVAMDQLTKTMPEENWQKFLQADQAITRNGHTLHIPRPSLDRIGYRLSPLLSFGVLNGGAATSFVDATKNSSLYPDYFPLVQKYFKRDAAFCSGKPKALTPACYGPDGKPGPSFLDLKLRSLSCFLSTATQILGSVPRSQELLPLLPWVQMVNTAGKPHLELALANGSTALWNVPSGALNARWIKELRNPLTGVQELLSAFAVPGPDKTYPFFRGAFGQAGEVLGLPGGHGSAYSTLRPVFETLYQSGKRFVYLGNIDNIGLTPNPHALAIAVLLDAEGLFEFSLKTAMDAKGGILVETPEGKLTCTDIGLGIGIEEVKAFEKAGKPILFNCATGLFSLAYLVEHVDDIAQKLPLRASLQKKDAGTYFQAEQSAWEILGILEKPVVLGVAKAERFLAGKVIMESYLTSGLKLEESLPAELLATAHSLNDGLKNLLSKVYNL